MKIVFYSMYGHIYRMAGAEAEGAGEVEGARVDLLQVPELVPDEVLEKSGAKAARAAFAHIPVATPNDLADADAIILGIPTRFGNICAQMRNFLDQTGGLWARNALVGKVGNAFTSSSTQHGGQETTLVTTYVTLLHLGMVMAAPASPPKTNWPWPGFRAGMWPPSPPSWPGRERRQSQEHQQALTKTGDWV